MLRSRFLGTGFAVPDRVVTNDDLSQIMDTSDEWIRTRTGIRRAPLGTRRRDRRRLALARHRRALEMAGIAPADVDAIVYATSTPDHFAPGNGVFLQRELGIGHHPRARHPDPVQRLRLRPLGGRRLDPHAASTGAFWSWAPRCSPPG